MTIIRLLMANRWTQVLALVIAGVALVFLLDRCAARIMSSVKETRRTEQQASDLKATINQVEKANAAADKVRRDGGAARDDCLLDNRAPENC
ncbi:MAG TPA: hypothetical protein VNS79_02055 [Sphingobium sp.]|nr:hypothetical protein [Sphingobium sp.]